MRWRIGGAEQDDYESEKSESEKVKVKKSES